MSEETEMDESFGARQVALSIHRLLDDEYGISTQTWVALMDFLQSSGEFELIGELSRMVRATDDRWYIPE